MSIFVLMKNRKLKNSELGRISPSEYKERAKTPLILILDNVRSLNNIGSVFRTADAFLIDKIYLCGITATPPHKDIQKTALGATDSVNWVYAESTHTVIKDLQKEGVVIAAIEQAENAVLLQDFKVERNTSYALIFGNEVKGVQQEIVSSSDVVIEIPQFGTKHSLNISVSAGVAVWDIYVKLKAFSDLP